MLKNWTLKKPLLPSSFGKFDKITYMKKFNQFLLLIFCLIGMTLWSQETTIMIRAKAKDAKFIGSSIGGAKIIVKDAITGEILDQGITSGGTGNTDLIMKTAQERGKELSDANTAGFTAKLNISEPTFVDIEAFAPINKKQARVKASTQTWIIPGKNIDGDGIILEIPGFVIDILAPQTHEGLDSNAVDIKANIVMMCGCPVSDGGIWNSENFQIRAIARTNGKKVKEIDLEQTEKSSTFSGQMNLESGIYEILVYAFDPATGNTGLDKTNIIIR